VLRRLLNKYRNIFIDDFHNQNTLMVSSSGFGDVTLHDFDGLEDLIVKLKITGDFRANRSIAIDNLDLKISGIGDYAGFKITSTDCVVSATGIGNSELTSLNSLDVFISGTGDVSYKGSPTITQNISGFGDLIDAK